MAADLIAFYSKNAVEGNNDEVCMMIDILSDCVTSQRTASTVNY